MKYKLFLRKAVLGLQFRSTGIGPNSGDLIIQPQMGLSVTDQLIHMLSPVESRCRKLRYIAFKGVFTFNAQPADFQQPDIRVVSMLLGAHIGDILLVRCAFVHTDGAAVAQIAIALCWAASVVSEGHICSGQGAFKPQPGQPGHILPNLALQIGRNTSGHVYVDFQNVPEEGLPGHA